MEPPKPNGHGVGRRESTRFLPLLHTVSQTVAFPHGYTLLIWGTSMMTVSRHGLPSMLSIFCFLAGSWFAYVTTGSYAKHEAGRLGPGQQRLITQPFVVASANILTLFLATGAGAIVSMIPLPVFAWLAVGVTGTAVYMFGIALQAFLISRRLDPQPPDGG